MNRSLLILLLKIQILDILMNLSLVINYAQRLTPIYS